MNEFASEILGLSRGRHTFRVVATDNTAATSSDTFTLIDGNAKK